VLRASNGGNPLVAFATALFQTNDLRRFQGFKGLSDRVLTIYQKWFRIK
jgi:hypothetical protein